MSVVPAPVLRPADRDPESVHDEGRTSRIRTLWGTLLHPKLGLWAAKGVLAITDQGLFAGSSFVLNVLLARWLTVTEYGTFALAYSVFLLFVAFHSAAFVEPMLVFGPGKYSRAMDEYLGILIRGHFLLMLPLSLLLAFAGGLAAHWKYGSVGPAFLALALAVPFLLLMWLLRRAFYVESRLGGAISGGVLYLTLVVGLLFATRAVHRVSAVTALLMMTASAIITSLFLLLFLRPRWNSGAGVVKSSEVSLDHWRYGRWSIAAALVSYIPLNIYYLVLPAWSGLAGTATLRALMNLINPVVHILIALVVLLLPSLVRSRRSGGLKKMKDSMTAFLFVTLIGTGLFCIGLWTYRFQVLQLLYGGRYQNENGGAILFLLLFLLATCFSSVLTVGLMALERPDRNLWAYVGSTIVALLVGLPLVAFRGVEGAAEGMFASASMAAGLMYFFYRRAASPGIGDSESLEAGPFPDREERVVGPQIS
ncbi:MAG: hypothetical protein WBQ89_20420 [Candidatus Acidiferrum sp.]